MQSAIMLAVWMSTVGASAGIEARVDRNQVVAGESVLLDVVISGSRSAKPVLPPLPDFDVQPHGTNSNFRIVNGSMSSSVTHSFLLFAKRPGRFLVGSVTAEIDGERHESAPFSIRVGQATMVPDRGQSLTFTSELSSTTPFVGEQILYTLTFRRRIEVSGAELSESPTPGFHAEKLNEPETQARIIDGQRVSETVIRRAITAKAAGQAIVPGSTLNVKVPQTASRQTRRNDPFGDFFRTGGRSRSVRLTTDDRAVTVRPLPEAPEGFTGLVGQFKLHASLSTPELAVGGSGTLTVSVVGLGNVRDITAPELTLPSGFKAYADAPSEEFAGGNTGLRGERTYRTALVATTPGTYSFPPVRLVFFDPKAEIYRTQEVPLGDITVTGEAPAPPKETPAETVTEPVPENAPTDARGLMGGLLALALALGGLVGARRVVLQRRASLAAKRAKILKTAAQTLECPNAAVTEIRQALRDVLGVELGLPVGSVADRHAVLEALRARNASQACLTLAEETFEALDAAEYSGMAAGGDHAQRVRALIDALPTD